MDKVQVTVKKIRYYDENTKKYIFEGLTTVKKQNNTGKFVKAKVRENFKGAFMSLYLEDELEVTGYWRENERYGKEFIVYSYEKKLPQTIKGIRVFLKQIIKGVGEKRVKAITDAYGEQSLEIIAKDIKSLDIFTTLSQKQKEAIWLGIAENVEFENLLAFMQLNDLDYTLAIKIYNKFKCDSVIRIRTNPYMLFTEDLVPFSTCDQIAKNLNCPASSHERLHAAIYSFIKEDIDVNGNLYTNVDFLKDKFNTYLKNIGKYKDFKFSKKEIVDGLKFLEEDGKIIFDHNNDNQKILYLKNNLYIENKIVQHLKRKVLKSSPNLYYSEEAIESFLTKYQNDTGVSVAKNQKEAVRASLQNMVSIITGGPGTGKTQTMATLIQCIKSITPSASIFLCSPTGKAAKRMCEMSGMQASTI